MELPKQWKHFIKIKLILFFYLIFFAKSVKLKAEIISPEYILNKRNKITPKLEDKTAKPLNFSRSNNLRRRSGSYFVAKGEFLILKGVVTDLLDNPISGVKIEIWQADNFGHYKYLIDNDKDYSIFDVDFEGTGTAITNNLGYYQFYTIFPGFYGNRTPHIHMRIRHKLFDIIETEVFFENHPRNKIDKKFTSLNEEKQQLLTCDLIESNEDEVKICVFNIKIDFINPVK